MKKQFTLNEVLRVMVFWVIGQFIAGLITGVWTFSVFSSLSVVLALSLFFFMYGERVDK